MNSIDLKHKILEYQLKYYGNAIDDFQNSQASLNKVFRERVEAATQRREEYKKLSSEQLQAKQIELINKIEDYTNPKIAATASVALLIGSVALACIVNPLFAFGLLLAYPSKKAQDRFEKKGAQIISQVVEIEVFKDCKDKSQNELKALLEKSKSVKPLNEITHYQTLTITQRIAEMQLIEGKTLDNNAELARLSAKYGAYIKIGDDREKLRYHRFSGIEAEYKQAIPG